MRGVEIAISGTRRRGLVSFGETRRGGRCSEGERELPSPGGVAEFRRNLSQTPRRELEGQETNPLSNTKIVNTAPGCAGDVCDDAGRVQPNLREARARGAANP